MTNLYRESEDTIAMLRSGEIPRGSVIKVQWTSGNSETVRVHGYNLEKGVMLGCNMGWDNGAIEQYDLLHGVVNLVSKPKADDERWL